METNLVQAALRQRCSKPYGPFVIVHWPPQRWGVMRAIWLEDTVVCRHLLSEPAVRCRAWLLRTTTLPEPLMPTPVAALQLLAALLEEEARQDTKQSSLLLAARREALDALWGLVDDTEPEQPHVRASRLVERRAHPRY